MIASSTFELFISCGSSTLITISSSLEDAAVSFSTVFVSAATSFSIGCSASTLTSTGLSTTVSCVITKSLRASLTSLAIIDLTSSSVNPFEAGFAVSFVSTAGFVSSFLTSFATSLVIGEALRKLLE